MSHRMTLAAVAVAALLTSGAGPQDGLRTAVLGVHNAERGALGLPPLQWDPDLAAGAADWARVLAARGRLEHSPREARPNQGENLSMGTTGRFTARDLQNGWVEEKVYYRHRPFPDVSTTGRWSDVGHYTQMIWRNTTAVGCAMAIGRTMDVLVCRYAPPGNWQGQMAY